VTADQQLVESSVDQPDSHPSGRVAVDDPKDFSEVEWARVPIMNRPGQPVPGTLNPWTVWITSSTTSTSRTEDSGTRMSRWTDSAFSNPGERQHQFVAVPAQLCHVDLLDSDHGPTHLNLRGTVEPTTFPKRGHPPASRPLPTVARLAAVPGPVAQDQAACGVKSDMATGAHPKGTDELPAQEWGAEHLDVDAYLARIGYQGQLTPGGEALRDLHRAHASAIPFENLEILLGRPLPLDLPSLEEKLIRHRRGGYCYEHNLLFAALAERLGYPVTRFLGRVRRQDDRPGPLTHMVLVVHADGVSWLADVGFGAGLLEPIPLTDEATVAQEEWTYRLERHGRHWRLGTLDPNGWSELYRFTEEPQHRVDYEVANYYTATHPDSPFVGKMVVMRTQPGARHRLIGDQLTTTHPDGTNQRRQVAAGQLSEVLAEVFGIELEPDDAARLASQLPCDQP